MIVASSSARPRWAIAACLLLLGPGRRLSAQTPGTDADRAFAAILVKLPDSEARARIASAEMPEITAGLVQELRLSVVGLVNRRENAPEAIRVLRLAIQAGERGGFALEEADARFGLGSPLITVGRIEDALESYNRAEQLYKQANAPVTRIIGVYTNRANANRHLGNLQAALDDNRQAEKLTRERGDEVALARVLNNTGLVYQEMGDYRNAMRVLQQSLEIAVRHKERLGQAYVLNNLSSAAMLGGDYEPAAAYAQQSLEIKEAIASKEDVVTSLTNLGSIYHHAGKDVEAERTLRRAIAIANETSRPTIKAEALDQLGALEFDRKNFAAAQTDFEQARALYHDAGEKVYEASATSDVARVLFEKRQDAAALEMANLARNMARDAGAIPDVLTPSVVAGRALRRLNRDGEARAAFDEAISTVEQMRYMVGGGEFERENFLAERIAPYREMTSLEIHQGHWSAALAMSERAKGRALLDLLSGGREQPGRFMTAAERARDAQLRGRLATLGAQFRLLSAQPQPPQARIRELRDRMDKTRAGLDDFRLAFYAAHPELGVRRGDVQPIDGPAASALAADDKTALLDYVLTGEGAYLFVIVRSRPLSAHRLTNAASLDRQIKEFREKLATRDPNFADAADRLFQSLMGPAAAEIAGKSKLIIAPDGPIWQAPFQALRSPGGHYLIQDSAISYAPSLSVLAALRKSRRPAPATPALGAFGNPTGDIAESEHEVQKVAALYAPNGNAWIGADATEETFRQRAGNLDVIHIAAHGVFDDRNPLRSKLVFHSPAAKAAQDGWLEASEIRELDLHASLVVLSGCETARGGFEDGEGAIGMAWAFLAGGGHSVVASQWRVESSSTTELMLKFHSGLRVGINKAEALRQAAVELMHNDRFRHPFYWAPFELVGDGY